jgi:ankyrin repeat protein
MTSRFGFQNSALLFLAPRLGNNEALAVLVRNGADVNASLGDYISPLTAVAENCSLESVKLLLDAGADVNVPNASYTALHCAAQRVDMDMMRLFISKGADVDGPGGTYGTALQAAAYHNRKLVEILLKHGADPNLGGGKFGSAIRTARAKGWLRVVKLFGGVRGRRS